MALTEKMKSFCREYFSNGGNGTQAYLIAYDGNSAKTASVESSYLLARDDIQDYLKALNRPSETKAINEREKKRQICWERIEYCTSIGDDAGAARWMDILNKMDSEYININRNIDAKDTEITNLDTDKLKKLIG